MADDTTVRRVGLVALAVVLAAGLVVAFLAATDRWVFAPDDPCHMVDDCERFGT